MGKSRAINPKTSKWLEGNLQAMDLKVHDMLKLIKDDDPDLARPQLVSLMEEFSKSCKSISEQYEQELKKPGKKKKHSDSSSSSSSSSEDESSKTKTDQKKVTAVEMELKFSNLENELKKMQDENANLQGTSAEDVKRLEGIISSMEAEASGLREEVVSTKGTLEHALSKAQEKEGELELLKKHSMEISTANKELSDDLRKEQEKFTVLLKEMGLNESAVIEDVVKELQQDCLRLREENAALLKEKELNSVSISQLEGSVAELKGSEGKLLLEQENLLKEQGELQEKHKGEIDAHEKDKSGLRELHANLQHEHKHALSQYDAKVEALKEEVLAGSKQISELQDQVSLLQTDKVERENTISAHVEYAKGLQGRVTEVLEKSGFQQDRSLGEGDVWLHQLQTLEHGVASLHDARRVSEERACSMEAEVEKLRAEIALAEEKFNVVTGEHQAKVNENVALSATLKELENELGRLKEAHVKVQETLTERQGTLTCLEQEKLELEGKVSRGLDEMTASKKLVEESSLQARSLQEELVKAQEKHATLANEHQRRLDETLVMKANLEALREEHAQLQGQHKDLEGKHMEILDAKCRLEADGTDKEKKLGEHVHRARSLEEQILKLENGKEAALQRTTEFEFEITHLKEQLAEMQRKQGELSEKVDCLRQEKLSLEGKVGTGTEEITRLQRTSKKLLDESTANVKSLEEEVLKIQENHATLSSEHQRGLKEMLTLTATLQSLKEEHHQLREEHKSLKKEHLAISEAKVNLESEGVDKDKEIAHHVDRACTLEEQICLLQSEKASLSENIKTESLRSKELAVEIAQLKEQLLEAQQKHEELSTSLSSKWFSHFGVLCCGSAR